MFFNSIHLKKNNNIKSDNEEADCLMRPRTRKCSPNHLLRNRSGSPGTNRAVRNTVVFRDDLNESLNEINSTMRSSTTRARGDSLLNASTSEQTLECCNRVNCSFMNGNGNGNGNLSSPNCKYNNRRRNKSSSSDLDSSVKRIL